VVVSIRGSAEMIVAREQVVLAVVRRVVVAVVQEEEQVVVSEQRRLSVVSRVVSNSDVARRDDAVRWTRKPCRRTSRRR
jgi:hypothetical protein